MVCLMKVLSLNVNNFGGTYSKPLPKNYTFPNGKTDFDSWKSAVQEWRNTHKSLIERNVKAIANLSHDFDMIFLHEVDTNCISWHLLLSLMSKEYTLKAANGINLKTYDKNAKSISCLFIKNGTSFIFPECNVLGPGEQRAIDVQIGDTYIVGVHMSYHLSDWEKLISKFKELQDKKLLILGDLNVYDSGTPRREYLDNLLNEGAIDLWKKQGENEATPTANTNKRIDYALVNQNLYEKGAHEIILNFIRTEKYSDHSAIAVVFSN